MRTSSSIGELPANWSIAKLSEITLVNPTLDKSNFPDGLEVSFVPMPAVQAQSGVIDVSAKRKFTEVKKGYTPFLEGDVLFAKITPCMENGKMAIVPAVRNGIGFGSTEFHVLRSLSEISAKYVYYYVSSQSFRREAEHKMSGAVGQKRVTTPYLTNCEIPVPPENEQHRIVAKIEELFSELDKGIENLKTARAQLKVYRQALLKHAFEGKLTAQWREQNRDKLETAAALLARIQTERAQRYQQQLQQWERRKSPSVPLLLRGKTSGAASTTSIPPLKKGGKGDLKPKAPKPLPPLTADELAELPELPEGWGWVRLDEISEKITDGDHQAPPQETDGIPFITISDIKNQRIDFSDTRHVSKSYFDGLSEMRKPVKDDILYTVTGSFGIPCLIDFERDFCFQRHIGLVRPCKNISNKFLFYVLSSRHVYGQAASVATGTAQKTVPLGGLRLFKIPLTSLEEQQQIALELDSRLSEADQLDQTLTASLQQSEALRQSILKKAFAGTLVAQDASDEPAAVLLARIKVERATTKEDLLVRQRRK